MCLILSCLGCGPDREVVQIYKGDPGKDGTSCTVAPELDTETSSVLGAKISCTDGSYSIVYNGEKGDQGIQGPQGNQGIQGPQGLPGLNAQPCQAYRLSFLSTTFLACPGQWPVAIFDGRDGKDGESCSSTRQSSQKRVKITCGNAVTYVYDGEDGKNGKDGKDGSSCTVTPAPGGANVKCGNDSPVFLANGSQGPQGLPGIPGAQGPQGLPGRDGLNGQDGEDAVKPGLSCNVHDLSNWNGVTNILTVLSASAPVGNFVMSNLNVGDTPSANGFPGMPASIQNMVGLTGYALDCQGYLNVETSGMHTFKTLSDDGVRLVIQDQVIINNPSLHAPTTDVSTSRELHRGPNKINVVYYQGPHTQIALRLSWSGPNMSEQVVPAARFTH
jgi:hypothetical protein